MFAAINVLGLNPSLILSLDPIVCPFKLLTSIPCPGCGMTHAFVALASLEIRQAFSYNPFSLPLFAGIAISAFGIKIPASKSQKRAFYTLSLAATLLWWAMARLAPSLMTILGHK
ncbi:MAG: DUF2752 domain-containing protein [Candidatus Methanosuratincola sp.]